MGTAGGITYGAKQWRIDPSAAQEEAERRIALVLSDPVWTELFLSDLFALLELPASLAKCINLVELHAGDAKGPDDVAYFHGRLRVLTGWERVAGLTRLQSLNCSGIQISDLAPLEALTGLQSLDCSRTQISDLAPLKALTGLQSLNCSRTQISDLAPLEALTGLQSLDCSRTQISDLAPLKGLTGLQSLDCSGTKISDFAPLASLTGLKSLICSETQISNLAPLADLTGIQRLSCSRTQISDLAPLAGLTRLRSLNCPGTQISDLAPLKGLTGLQSLDCSRTQISDLAPLKGLTELQSLSCSETQIRDLAPLEALTGLQSLDCSRTQIGDLAPLEALTGLQRLSCSRTQIGDLAPLAGLTRLQSLSCSRTQISDLAPLETLTELHNLICSGTQIGDLSPLEGLTGLQSLSCPETKIVDLAPLEGLTGLRNLICWGTPICDLTPLADLTGLQRLGCSGTQISDLAPLKALTGLQSLSCSRTQISDLAPLEGLIGLQSLSCSGTQISDLAPLKALTELRSLDCSRTQISDLAPLKALTELRSLDCSRTQISNLAPLETLTELHNLICSRTQISDLAPLEDLIGLQRLNCSGTQIRDLAPLKGLTGLQSFNCSGTQIGDLVPLAGLKGLQSLDCSGTPICDVSCLSSCPTLRSVRLINCNLDNLPTALIWSENLLAIEASGACFPGIPDEILSQSTYGNCLKDLRAHLNDLGTDPETLGDVKLSVLGNGRIGKTQICNRLRDLPFEPNADSTHGVVLSTAPIPESEYVFNLWDFGGQDIYHGTHTLFLRSRAIFLVVWTPETDNYNTVSDPASGMIFRNQKLDWWLDYVRRYASHQSPLIVVQNQIDVTPDNGEHPAVVTLRQEGRQGFCRSMGYSAKNKTGHPTLLDNLTQAVARFNPPLIGKGRKAMIAHLRALRAADERRPAAEREHRLMSLTDFEAECSRIGGISNPRLFLIFLNNAGEIFWREGCFDNNIILDQAWVLEAVYTVFDREKCAAILTQQGGRFSSDLLDVLVWGGAGYSKDDQRLFLDFMVSAGICFEVGSYGSTKYIAPDYLPVDDSERGVFSLDRRNAHRLRFDSLPPLLMRNLISRVGRETRDNAHYWRNGVVYFDTQRLSRVLIEQSSNQEWLGEIRIVAEGGDKRKAMDAAIAAVLEEAQRLGASSKEDHQISEDACMSTGPDPAKPTTFYVSYAWNDKTDSASENLEESVDGLCTEATRRSIQVHRDKDDIKLGGRISEYMARLVRGDRIIVILSDRYLRSRACMTELYEIWMQSKAEDAAFLEKVRIFTHPGTKIFTPVDRAKIAKYWSDLYQDEKELLDYMGGSDRVNHLALKKFAAHVGDILTLVADTLHPRNLDQLLVYCFD